MEQPLVHRAHLFRRLTPGMVGLDLGAGDGRWTIELAHARTRVTAVDRKPSPGNLPIGASWICADVNQGLDAILGTHHDPFNYVVCWNLIQFLDKTFVLEHLLPSLATHVAPGCTLALRTFFDQPDPSFAHPVPTLYRCEELIAALDGWEILNQKEHRTHGVGLDKKTWRHWHLTDVLAERT